MSQVPLRTRSVVLRTVGAGRPYASSDALEVAPLRLDPPEFGELLVSVRAAGICHSDLSVVNGSRPRPVPMALGHEAAGIVEAVGPGVSDVAVGDHVVLVFAPSCGLCPECADGRTYLCRRGAASNGEGTLLRGGRRLRGEDGTNVHHHLGVSAFAEMAVVDRSSVVVIPDSVPFDVAALFGCALLTGTGAIQYTADVRAGQSVAVFGLGGVGMAALLGAALAGADPIIAVDPVPHKREIALELGATAAFDAADAVSEIRAVIPAGVDHAIEAVGSAAVMDQAFQATARGGTTVAVGLPHPSKQLSLPAAQIVAEARTVVGSYMGSAVPQRDVPRLIRLWQNGRLPVERLLGGTVGLDGVAAALDALDSGVALRQIVVP